MVKPWLRMPVHDVRQLIFLSLVELRNRLVSQRIL
jgi:hypothetical protein